MTRPSLRHRWNHQARLHREVVKAANRGLATIPPKALYRSIMWYRRKRLPYSLIAPGDAVVQVGAPSDTLTSGRSRALSFGLLTPQGRTLAIEPSQRSVRDVAAVAESMGVTSLEVEQAALYSSARGLVRLYEDDDHPARNFIEPANELIGYDESTLAEFYVSDVETKTLDQVWEERLGSCPLRLVSVTTNGSEGEILEGGRQALAQTAYLALAVTSDEVTDFAMQAGFELIGNDDRGFTYRRRSHAG